MRSMWQAVAKATNRAGAGWDHHPQHGVAGPAVVLTTHSMEECEALCDRVGIMHKVRAVTAVTD